VDKLFGKWGREVQREEMRSWYNIKDAGDRTVEGKEQDEGDKNWKLGPEMGSYQQGSVRAVVNNILGTRAK